MQVYYKLEDIKFSLKRAITVGTYDGVHLGHQSILTQLKNSDSSDKFKSMLVTFEPHPRIFLDNSNNSIKLLTTIEERLSIFEELGIDEVFVLPFDKNFANITAEDFIINYLYKKIGFSDFLIGFNHNFGYNREGSYDLLKSLLLPNINIIRCEPIYFNNITVSSSKIRNLIINKDIETANSMLGRFYSVSGLVVDGHKVGKKLGFPTANIHINNNNKLLPPNGVYSCDIKIFKKKFHGMASIGNRPTFNKNNSQEQSLLEVNIFDFNEDIYNHQITIYFKNFLREEKKFASVEALVEQIKQDKIAAID